jgi:uncharacterized protein YdeI (YjbR/CyaY-like superfamily)
MTEAGLVKIKAAKKSGEWQKAALDKDEANVPPDLEEALERNKKARENFANFAPSHRQQYVGWILSAKRYETRAKRIKETVKLAAQNKKPGMM